MLSFLPLASSWALVKSSLGRLWWSTFETFSSEVFGSNLKMEVFSASSSWSLSLLTFESEEKKINMNTMLKRKTVVNSFATKQIVVVASQVGDQSVFRHDRLRWFTRKSSRGYDRLLGSLCDHKKPRNLGQTRSHLGEWGPANIISLFRNKIGPRHVDMKL